MDQPLRSLQSKEKVIVHMCQRGAILLPLSYLSLLHYFSILQYKVQLEKNYLHLLHLKGQCKLSCIIFEFGKGLEGPEGSCSGELVVMFFFGSDPIICMQYTTIYLSYLYTFVHLQILVAKYSERYILTQKRTYLNSNYPGHPQGGHLKKLQNSPR